MVITKLLRDTIYLHMLDIHVLSHIRSFPGCILNGVFLEEGETSYKEDDPCIECNCRVSFGVVIVIVDDVMKFIYSLRIYLYSEQIFQKS